MFGIKNEFVPGEDPSGPYRFPWYKELPLSDLVKGVDNLIKIDDHSREIETRMHDNLTKSLSDHRIKDLFN